MELVGRITKDAVVSQLKDERKVVNFSIAVNDYYKPKGSAEGVKLTTYVNCSYCISSKIAVSLTKGSLVAIAGRIYVNAFAGTDGQPKASLNCHVSSIKIHSFGKQEVVNVEETNSKTAKEEVADDLPF